MKSGATQEDARWDMAANRRGGGHRNKAPVFEDQDTETDGVQNTEATRKVEENTKAVAARRRRVNDVDVEAADNVGRPGHGHGRPRPQQTR